MISFLFFFIILLLALLNTPLFAILSLITIYLTLNSGGTLTGIIIEMYRITNVPTLVALPLFTYAGYILSKSNAPKRIVNLANQIFSHIPGGLAITTLVTCAIFTAFTGASGVTIIAIGGLVYPILIKQDYDEKLTLGLVTTSGSLGLLFAPSLPIILYGTVSQTSIEKLYIAGILPGLLLIILLSIFIVLKRKKEIITLKQTKFNIKEFYKAIKNTIFEIPIPFVVLFLILKGIITLPEASVITVFYVFIVEFFIKKDLSLKKDFIPITTESMIMIGGILIILSMALGLTNYLVMEEVPMKIFEFIEQYISNKYVFLILLNIFLIIVGCMMDIFSAIVVVVPIIIPVAKNFGIDPVHLGIIFLANLEIGYLTPPVGMNLFISSFRFKKNIIEVYKATIPYILILLLGLLIITYIPKLTLFFVN